MSLYPKFNRKLNKITSTIFPCVLQWKMILLDNFGRYIVIKVLTIVTCSVSVIWCAQNMYFFISEDVGDSMKRIWFQHCESVIIWTWNPYNKNFNFTWCDLFNFRDCKCSSWHTEYHYYIGNSCRNNFSKFF